LLDLRPGTFLPSFTVLTTTQVFLLIGHRLSLKGTAMREPANPFHPGEMLLEEFLQPMGLTQTAFAERLGWTRARLNELINGKRGVTAEAALDLAEALKTTAKLWMNLQATFDLDRARRRRAKVA